MEQGIPILTSKGRDALGNTGGDLSALCRNILVQVDGKKSLEDIKTMFRGLKGLDEAVQKLVAGVFIEMSRECNDLVKSMLQQMLGPKSATLITKIDELNAKYGNRCWEHADELDRLARLFYGEVVADRLKLEITKLVKETGK